jgi:regulatory protein
VPEGAPRRGGDSPGARRPREGPAARRERRAAVEDVATVLEAAARFLEARPRSIAEVRRRLTGAGYRPDLVDQAVLRMVELGYLDDDAFARAWVESRDRARPRGEHALRRELGLKGVDQAIIGAALEERQDPGAATAFPGDVAQDPDMAAAERLLAKKMPALRREADPRRRRQRAYAVLARAGFTPDICSSLSRGLLADADAPEPEDIDAEGAEPGQG